MRIGIVGAGLNSEYHINFSKSYPGAAIVGIADSDPARARQRAEQYGIPGAFSSVEDLLREAAPDVVHVVTPPMTHADVVRTVLNERRHVLVEKPLALNAAAARSLYDLARARGVRLCPVHNHLFDPCAREADAIITSGRLGRVVNVESYYGLNTNIPAFRDYPRPNVLPWLYSLPGGVYQDFFPHALYMLLEYTGRARNVSVLSRSTGVLPQRLPDEIRVMVDGEHAPGIVTFSFSAKPFLHFIRVYGTEGMVEVDINTMTALFHPVSGLPKAAQKATYNLSQSWSLTRSTVRNVVQFVTGRLKPYQGMRTLIHEFYRSIESNTAPPISEQKGLAVVETMDEIFRQMPSTPLRHTNIVPARSASIPAAQRVLVTGGTGFLGKAVVGRLIEAGYAVRVLARKLSNVEPVAKLGAEIFWGDVADLESFEQALIGCEQIVHLAAGTSGRELDSERGTIQGTQNLIALCRRDRVQKLVYVSSCSVYGIADCPRNAVLTESAPLERFPDRRGSYSASKQAAESAMAEFMRSGSTPVVILRPGTIFGPGGDQYTPMMGFRMGRVFAVIGMGGFQLPFVYVDNVAAAIAVCLRSPAANGETFNVVDPEPLTKRDYMNKVIRRVQPGARVFYLPYSLLYAATWFQEIVFRLLGRRPVLTRYRLTSSQKAVRYDSRRLANMVGWRPPVTLADALERIAASPASPPPADTEPQSAVIESELAHSGAQ